MIISNEGYVMLLAEPFFQTFTTREVCDTARHTEALIALSCESRSEVDDLVKKAAAAGGREAMPTQEHGQELLRPRRSSLGSGVDGPEGGEAGAGRVHGIAAEVARRTASSSFDLYSRQC